MRLAEEADDTVGKALARRALGEACARCRPSDPPRAEEHMLEAIRLFEEMGARPELARTHVSYARLLNEQGLTDKAKAHLTRAVALFTEMGMVEDAASVEHPVHAA
jgi:hypothetical protein